MSNPTPDSIIRENIKKHFHLHKRLEPAIDLYEKMIRQNPDKQKDIHAQQIIKGKYNKNLIKSHEELEFVELAANISVWKEEYHADKNYMESIMRQIETNTLSFTRVIRDHPMFTKLLTVQQDTLLKNIQARDEYIYDKYIEDPKRGSKIYFTYIEEDSLLEELHRRKQYHVKSQKVPCFCQICALVHLRSLVYYFAKITNRNHILERWTDEKAEESWLHEFQTRHKKYIDENFPSEEECKFDPVASQTFDIRPNRELGCAEDEQPSSSTSVSQTSSQRKETLEPSFKKPRVDSPPCYIT